MNPPLPRKTTYNIQYINIKYITDLPKSNILKDVKGYTLKLLDTISYTCTIVHECKSENINLTILQSGLH